MAHLVKPILFHQGVASCCLFLRLPVRPVLARGAGRLDGRDLQAFVELFLKQVGNVVGEQTQVDSVVFLDIGDGRQSCMNDHDAWIDQLSQRDAEQAFRVGQSEEPGHGVRGREACHGHGGDIDGEAFSKACEEGRDHAFDDVQGAVDDGKLNRNSASFPVDLLSASKARFGHGRHINGLAAILDNGVHDPDLLVSQKHAPGHEPNHIGLIHGFGDTGEVFKGGLHQLARLIVINKGSGTAHAEGIFRDPELIPLGCRVDSLLHQGGKNVDVACGFVKSGEAGVFEDLPHLRVLAPDAHLLQDAERILVDFLQQVAFFQRFLLFSHGRVHGIPPFTNS